MSEEDTGFGDDTAYDEDIDRNQYGRQTAKDKTGRKRGCPLAVVIGFLSLVILVSLVSRVFSLKLGRRH